MEVGERRRCESFDEDVDDDVRVVEGGVELVSVCEDLESGLSRLGGLERQRTVLGWQGWLDSRIPRSAFDGRGNPQGC
jgi:hypothetical protein